MRNRKRITILGIVLLVVLAGAVLGEEKPLEIKKLELRYQNELFSAEIQSATIKEIFDEFKKNTGMEYSIDEEIKEKRVTIEIKDKELVQGIKDILNTIGNPSYMFAYKRDKNGKYEVSRIEIRKTGSSSPSAKSPGDLQPGEMEVGLVDGKYKIRANNADANELLAALSDIGDIHSKIIADKIDGKITIEAEEGMLSMTFLQEELLRKIRPKIYKVNRIMVERDKNGRIIKPAYFTINRLTDAEIQKRREQAEKKNADVEKLMKEGRYSEALSVKGGSDPDYAPIQINLGKIYLINRDYLRAIDHFNWAIEIDSTNSDAWLGLIEAYKKEGKIEKQLESMENYILYSKDEAKVKEIKNKIESLKEEPNIKYYSLLKKGDEYRAKRDIEHAIIEYDNAIKIKPDLIFAYGKMGQIYEETQDYQKAEDMYKKAIEKDADNHQVYGNLAMMYIKIKKNKEAIEVLEKVKEIYPAREGIFKIDEMIESLKQDLKDEK